MVAEPKHDHPMLPALHAAREQAAQDGWSDDESSDDESKRGHGEWQHDAQLYYTTGKKNKNERRRRPVHRSKKSKSAREYKQHR